MKILLPEWIAPVAPRAGVLTGHAVVLDGSRIAALLPAAEALARHPEAERHELPGHLLTPGLVNLHCHAAMSLLRGAGDDLPLERWLREVIWPLESRLVSPEFVLDGSLAAGAEMLLGGITCFSDMYLFPEATAEASLELGLRVALGILVFDFPTAYGSGPADYLHKGLELRDRLRDEPLTSFCLAPHAPYTVSDPALERVASLSGELGLPVHMHVHETAREVDDSLREYGVRPLARLARLGLLTPDLIAVHAVHLDDADIDLLARHGASVAHCPHSNLKLASGIARTAELHRRGVNVGIGTDGAASNNRLDLLQEGRTAALLAKGSSGDATAWNAARTLEAMTLSGARALGLQDRIGSIEPGKEADLVAVDLGGLETSPVFDPVAQMIWCAGREQVREVWVAGRHVISGRRFVSADVRSRLEDNRARRGLWHNRVSDLIPAGAAFGGTERS